jgi:hypothetical protein
VEILSFIQTVNPHRQYLDKSLMFQLKQQCPFIKVGNSAARLLVQDYA